MTVGLASSSSNIFWSLFEKRPMKLRRLKKNLGLAAKSIVRILYKKKQREKIAVSKCTKYKKNM